MTRKPRSPIAEIAAAIQGRGKLGHSRLYWWMWDHYDEIRNGRHGRADWITVTENLTKLGLVNKDGSPLKVENVRKTYGRVVRDKDKLGAPPVTSAKREPALRTPGVTIIPEAAPPKAGTSRMEEVLESMKAASEYRKPKGQKE